MIPSMKLTWDQGADALYLSFLDDEGEAVSRTEQLDAGTMVDLDRFGHVLGIEVLRPARPWPLEEVLRRFEVAEVDRHALTALFERRGAEQRYPFAKPLAVA
jgi:uncharacterized protein YuzE